ncbi:hypothetical protein [Megalodesulfovibrio paquesii]
MRAALLLMLIVLSGCAARQHGSFAGDGLAPEQARLVARDAADRLAAAYPPGRTALQVPATPGVFGQVLDQELRAKGFALEPGGLALAFVLDALRDEPGIWYLQLSAADGFAFSRTYMLGAQTGQGQPLGGVAQTGVTHTGAPAASPAHQAAGQ